MVPHAEHVHKHIYLYIHIHAKSQIEKNENGMTRSPHQTLMTTMPSSHVAMPGKLNIVNKKEN